MKKLIMTAAAVFAFGFANAQSFKPVKGTLTTEVGVSGGIINTDFNTINSVAKFRYFLKDDLALRAGLGLASKSEETNTVPAPNGNFSTIVDKFSTKNFAVGVEKHFAGTERLSTYVGADLFFGFTGASSKGTNNYNSYSTTIEGAGLGKRAGSQIGLRVTTGADYYFTKKLYLGVEVGLGYAMNSTDEVKTTTVNALGTNTATTSAKGSISETATNVIGGLKLGYQF